MNLKRFAFALFLGLAISMTGCKWGKSEQANVTVTSFDTLATSEELAQLPQVSGIPQQTSIEILPVEASPVTPSAATTAASDAAGSLSYNQKIQTALKNAGLYSGAIDGKIGPMTRRAIETFQKNNGLKVDGKVGPKTWAVLEPFLNAPAESQTTIQ